jgi:hypothetical protein
MPCIPANISDISDSILEPFADYIIGHILKRKIGKVNKNKAKRCWFFFASLKKQEKSLQSQRFAVSMESPVPLK